MNLREKRPKEKEQASTGNFKIQKNGLGEGNIKLDIKQLDPLKQTQDKIENIYC